MNRRRFIQTTSLAGAVAISGTTVSCSTKSNIYQNGISPWPICLNTSTIRKESLEEQFLQLTDNNQSTK